MASKRRARSVEAAVDAALQEFERVAQFREHRRRHWPELVVDLGGVGNRQRDEALRRLQNVQPGSNDEERLLVQLVDLLAVKDSRPPAKLRERAVEMAKFSASDPRNDPTSYWHKRLVPSRPAVPCAGDAHEASEEAARRTVQEIQFLVCYTEELLDVLAQRDRGHSRDGVDPEKWCLVEFAYLDWLTFELSDLLAWNSVRLSACRSEPFRVPLLKQVRAGDTRLMRAPSAHEALCRWSVAALVAAQHGAAGRRPRWEYASWPWWESDTSLNPGADQHALLTGLARNPQRAREALADVVPPFDKEAWRQGLNFEVAAAIEGSGPDVQVLVDQVASLSRPAPAQRRQARSRRERIVVAVHTAAEKGAPFRSHREIGAPERIEKEDVTRVAGKDILKVNGHYRLVRVGDVVKGTVIDEQNARRVGLAWAQLNNLV